MGRRRTVVRGAPRARPSLVGGVIERSRLASGLEVVTETVPAAASVSLGAWVGTGSRDEEPKSAGACHFLEHLLFKGTATWSARAIAEAMDAVGGEFNAFTTKEYTAFYVRLLGEDLSLGLDILCDVVWSASLRAHDVDAERQVILEEILMRGDDPADLAHEALVAAMFPGHALGRDVLGVASSIEAMPAAGIRRFHRRHYRPENVVLAAAGALDHDEVARGVEARFAGQPGGRRPRRRPPVPPDAGGLTVTTRPTEQAHLVVGMPAPCRHDDRRWAVELLNYILGGGLSSRLFQEIRERRGLVYAVYSDWSPFEDAGVLSVYAGTAPRHLEEVAALMGSELDRLAEEGVTPRELDVARGALRAQTLLSLEDTGSRMSRVGRSTLLFDEALAATEVLDRLDAVTLDEVAQVAASVLEAPRTVAVVGPFEPQHLAGLKV
jgi:predicted Zn-dependent peptidase